MRPAVQVGGEGRNKGVDVAATDKQDGNPMSYIESHQRRFRSLHKGIDLVWMRPKIDLDFDNAVNGVSVSRGEAAARQADVVKQHSLTICSLNLVLIAFDGHGKMDLIARIPTIIAGRQWIINSRLVFHKRILGKLPSIQEPSGRGQSFGLP